MLTEYHVVKMPYDYHVEQLLLYPGAAAMYRLLRKSKQKASAPGEYLVVHDSLNDFERFRLCSRLAEFIDCGLHVDRGDLVQSAIRILEENIKKLPDSVAAEDRDRLHSVLAIEKL